MNRLFFALFSAVQIWAASAASADEQSASKWHGYIVDRQCAGAVRHDTDPLPFLKHHSKDCSLMPSCKRDGYSLYANGMWLDFSRSSSKSVFEAIKASKQRNGFYAEVVGRLQSKFLQVDKITEVKEPEQSADGGSQEK